MKRFLTFLLFASFLVLAACTKDSSTNNNNTSGTYLPLKTGNWWKYSATGNGIPATIKYTVTGDTTINGKVWKALKNDFNQATVWHRFEGTICHMRTPVSSFTIEVQLFDDKGKAGDSLINNMTMTVGNQTLSFRAVSKISAKYQNKTVNGKDYSDILEVSLVIYKVEQDNSLTALMTETDYFALNIGAIETDATGIMEKKLMEHLVNL